MLKKSYILKYMLHHFTNLKANISMQPIFLATNIEKGQNILINSLKKKSKTV